MIGSEKRASVFNVKETVFESMLFLRDYFHFIDLPTLKRIYLGYNSLYGDSAVTQQGRNTFVMRSMQRYELLSII